MEIWFTEKDAFFSRLLMSITGENISHCAIKLDSPFVVHSNILGPHVETSEGFLYDSDPVYKLKRVDGLDITDQDILDILAYKEFTLYDFGATLFVGVSLLLRRYLKIPLPKSNLWASTGMDQCVEFTADVIGEKDVSMMTPKQFMQMLLDSGKWELC